MVEFIPEASIEESENPSCNPKVRNSISSPVLTDQKLGDLSLADTFLDFDSIRDWFEQFPDDSGTLLSGELGSTMVKNEKVEDVHQGPTFDTTVDSIRDYWFEKLPNESATLQSGEFGSTVVKEEMLEQGPNLDASVNASIDQLAINEVSVKREMLTCENGEIGTSCILPTDDDASKNVDFTSIIEDALIENNGNAEIEINSVLGTKNDEVNAVISEKMDDKESETESESESSSSASSSSSSSSSSSEDEDDSSSEDDDDENEKKDKMEIKELGEMEEGEIREDVEKKTTGESSDVEEMFTWSDAEDDGDEGSSKGGVIRSKNELKFLPPVPPVEATLNPDHKPLPVGVVLSVLGTQVIVEGVENHTPLNEGSILWITESRSPLGIVDEIFGPVKNPYYMVRYNSEAEVPSGISQGSLVSFVPEFASFVLNEKSLYKKGYDASGDNDEELSEELEFSDDEKEAEYKRQQKLAKRGGGDMNNQNQKKNNNRKKGKDRETNWNNYNHNNSQQMPVNQDRSGGPSSSTVQCGGGFMGGYGQNIGGPVLPNPNGNWMNNGQMPPPQHQANGYPNGMPMSWPQQQAAANQFQLQPLLNQILANMVFPNMVQPNAPGAPNFGSWSGPMVQNTNNNMAVGIGGLSLGNNSNNPPFGNGGQGFEPNGLQNPGPGAPFGSNEAPRHFNRGGGAPFGRGGRAARRGGGRFNGGRGRRQYN